MPQGGLITSFLNAFMGLQSMERERKRDEQLAAQSAVDDELRRAQMELQKNQEETRNKQWEQEHGLKQKEFERKETAGKDIAQHRSLRRQQIDQQIAQSKLKFNADQIEDMLDYAADQEYKYATQGIPTSQAKAMADAALQRKIAALSSAGVTLPENFGQGGAAPAPMLQTPTTLFPPGQMPGIGQPMPAQQPQTGTPQPGTLGLIDVLPKVAEQMKANAALTSLRGEQEKNLIEFRESTAALKKAQVEVAVSQAAANKARIVREDDQAALAKARFEFDKWFKGEQLDIDKANLDLRRMENTRAEQGASRAWEDQRLQREKVTAEYKSDREKYYQDVKALKDKADSAVRGARAVKTATLNWQMSNPGILLSTSQELALLEAEKTLAENSPAALKAIEGDLKKAEISRNEAHRLWTAYKALKLDAVTPKGTVDKAKTNQLRGIGSLREMEGRDQRLPRNPKPGQQIIPTQRKEPAAVTAGDRVYTPAEARKLPKGTRFKGTDGNYYTVP